VTTLCRKCERFDKCKKITSSKDIYLIDFWRSDCLCQWTNNFWSFVFSIK